MLNFIKSLNKLVEGLLFLVLPVIVFYWALTLLSPNIVAPFVAILGGIFNPVIDPFRPYITYKVNYDNMTVDYTVLLFAFLVMFTAFLCTINGHILNFIEKISKKAAAKQKEQEIIKQREVERQEYINEINKNKTIYTVLKLTKNAPNESYLIKEDGSDFFSQGIVDSYEKTIKDAYLKYEGIHKTNKTDEENANCFIFYDIEKFLNYLVYLQDKVEEVNKGMLDLNVRFDYQVACHCSYSDASAEIDFDITSKILNLSANKEILLSELLTNRLNLLEDKYFNLLSRGIYLLNDKQIDVFRIEFN